MNAITRFSLKNSVAVVILCLLVLGFGFYSSTQIKQQTFPDVTFPAVFIQTVYPGASTEEIESEITKPIEQSLLGLKNYDSLTSSSAENSSSIFLQYPFGTNMDDKMKDAEGAVAKLTLPDKAKVTVQRLSFGEAPIYEAAIFSSKQDTAELQKTLEETVVPKLEKVSGVSSVTLKGATSQELRIIVDKDKAAQYGLSLSTIQTAIQSLDYALPLGSVSQDDNTIPIRLVGKIDSLDQIKNLQLSAGGQGMGAGAGAAGAGAGAGAPAGAQGGAVGAAKVKLSDVAEVTTVSTQNEITRYNGQASFIIGVVKTQDANTADVSDDVKAELQAFQDKGTIDVRLIQDQGQDIKHSVSSLIHEGLYGALFCVIIIFLFLRNIRATLISIISLPISIFATIALMNQMGYTLNIMTLGGIAVSIGRIVDDSIVVIENIYRWRQEKGREMNGKELAFRATREVIGAVGSSTIATVVVFAPLAFVTGIIGEFFRPFAIAVVISILCSLLVAMMLIPVLGAKFFNSIKPHKQGGRFIDFYERVIRGALKRKAWVLALSVLLLIGSFCTIPLLGVAFLPAGNVASIGVDLKMPAQTPLEETNAAAGKVEAYLKGLQDIDNYQAMVGGVDNPFVQIPSTNTASFKVQFKEDAKVDTNALIDKANADLKQIVTAVSPKATVDVKEGEQNGPPTGSEVTVDLYSDDLTALSKAASQVENLMKANTDMKDVSNNLKDVSPKWVLSLNQTAKDLGVSAFQIMGAVNEQLRPLDVGTYTLDSKDWDITMSYKQQITSKSELENITIPTAAGVKKLSELAELSESTAPVSINHEEGKTYAEVKGNVKDTDKTSSVTKTITSDIDSLTLPDNVTVKIGGGLEMINSGFKSIGMAMGAAVGLVFLVMSMTFGGLRTPLIILSSLLFVPSGALGGLLVTGNSLSMSAMIGMLMLVGIVVTNAVVLLDRVETNRKLGMELRESLVEASKTRLRPILMTACATILALLPLALSKSSTSLISGGLAVTVIGGLATSTLLTLIVVPVIYEMTGKRSKVRKDIELND